MRIAGASGYSFAVIWASNGLFGGVQIMTLSLRRLLLIGLILAGHTQVNAENSAAIYQWTDEKGRIHFGDRPASHGGAVKQLPLPPVPGPSLELNERRAAEKKLLQLMTLERAQKEAAREQERIERLEHQRRCTTLGETLSQLETGRVVYYRENAFGEREFISDEERGRQADQVRDKWQRECG